MDTTSDKVFCNLATCPCHIDPHTTAKFCVGAGKAGDGSHLPVGWEVHLEANILPTSPTPQVKPPAAGQKQGDGRGEVPRKRGPVNAGLDQQHLAKKRRPTPPKCDLYLKCWTRPEVLRLLVISDSRTRKLCIRLPVMDRHNMFCLAA